MRNTNAPIWGAQAATRIKQPASLITGFVPPHRHGTNGGEGGRWAVYGAARWDLATTAGAVLGFSPTCPAEVETLDCLKMDCWSPSLVVRLILDGFWALFSCSVWEAHLSTR